MKLNSIGMGVLLLGLFCWGCGGGGSSSSSDEAGGGTTGTTAGGFSLTVTGQQPVSSSLSTRALALKGVLSQPKRITESSVTGVVYHAEDLSGTQIGQPCTAGTDGTCIITGLTEANLTAGYIIEGDNGMHAYGEMTSTEITTATTAGTALAGTVNTESDFAYATILAEGEGSLSACGNTVDCDALNDATENLVGEDNQEASDDDLGGYAQNNYEAHGEAIVDALAGTLTDNPATVMAAALRGDATAVASLQTAVGSTFNGIPLADTFTNARKMVTKVKDSYCMITEGTSPWKSVRGTAGANFDPRGVVGMFREFGPTEIDSYESEDFRGFMNALPNLDGGFQIFGGHPEAQDALAEQFRLGSFTDPTKAGPALGFMAATFPPPPTAGDWVNMSFTGFDPRVAARAGNNGFLEFVDGNADYLNFKADEIRDKFNTTFSDADYKQSFAMGGAGDFMDAFKSNGGFTDFTGFNPTEFIGQIGVPPGGSCSMAADCLPCDDCVGGICTSLSTKMGASCSSNDDCDGAEGITYCVGAFFSGGGGNCMCKVVIPPGANVFDTAGQEPIHFGMEGELPPPSVGSVGAQCNSGTPCNAGLTCSDNTSGVCLSATFKKGPYAPCSGDSECESASCASGLCAAFSATQLETLNESGGSDGGVGMVGMKTVGMTCAAPAECASYFCISGVCSPPPQTEVFSGATAGAGLKADGQSCTMPSECDSFFCSVGVCTPPQVGAGGTYEAPTNLPTGAFCMTSAECQSGICAASSDATAMATMMGMGTTCQ